MIDQNIGYYGLPVKSTARGLFWKISLGCLSKTSKDTWLETTKKQRTKYDTLKRVYIIDPRTAKDNTIVSDDPLSQNKDSIWNQFFENETTQKEIGHDITRTYPDLEFFERQDIQDVLTVKYLQGMNEILAPIVFACYADSHWGDYRQVHRHYDENEPVVEEYPTKPIPYPRDERDLSCYLRDARFFENDAYFIFDALMAIIGKWFTSPPSSPLPPPKLHGRKKEIYDDNEREASDAAINIIVVDQCFQIFHLLGLVDPHLHNYLQDMSIEPHLYTLRWLRILLAQVFPLNSLFILWDALFKDSVELLNYICVAMMLTIKDSLTHDPISLLHMAYTVRASILHMQEENPDLQIEATPKASKPPRQSHYTSKSSKPRPASTNSTSTTTTTTVVQSSTPYNSNSSGSSNSKATTTTTSNQASSTGGLGIFSSVANTFSKILSDLSDMEPVSEIDRLRENQIHVSSRIERLVYVLDAIRKGKPTLTSPSID
eukprot:gene16919-20124_t